MTIVNWICIHRIHFAILAVIILLRIMIDPMMTWSLKSKVPVSEPESNCVAAVTGINGRVGNTDGKSGGKRTKTASPSCGLFMGDPAAIGSSSLQFHCAPIKQKGTDQREDVSCRW